MVLLVLLFKLHESQRRASTATGETTFGSCADAFCQEIPHAPALLSASGAASARRYSLHRRADAAPLALNLESARIESCYLPAPCPPRLSFQGWMLSSGRRSQR